MYWKSSLAISTGRSLVTVAENTVAAKLLTNNLPIFDNCSITVAAGRSWVVAVKAKT